MNLSNKNNLYEKITQTSYENFIDIFFLLTNGRSNFHITGNFIKEQKKHRVASFCCEQEYQYKINYQTFFFVM